MAKKRMFAKSVINSGAFLKMPESAQALYIKISLNSDDDGYCDKYFTMKMTNGKEKDLRVLVECEFIYDFDNEVLLDLHWLKNNIIRKERKTDSEYLHLQPCHPNVTQVSPKSPHRVVKVRVVKVSKDTMSGKIEIPYQEIIDYLNKKTSSSYQWTTKPTQTAIDKSWEYASKLDKYKDDPIKAFFYVIDVTDEEWGDNPNMHQFRRPSTLFHTGKVKNNFEKYLNMKKKSEISKKKYGEWVNE